MFEGFVWSCLGSFRVFLRCYKAFIDLYWVIPDLTCLLNSY